MTAPQTLVEVFHRRWSDPARARHTALQDADRQLAYPALHQAVGQSAGRLRAAGVRRGQRVALVLPRGVEPALWLLAVMAAGACPCPMEPGIGAEETRRRHRLARFDWTLADAASWGDAGLDQIPAAQRLDPARLPADAPPWWDLGLAPADAGLLLFTSGSSGRPKGVLHSHRGLLANAGGIVERTDLCATDRLLLVMPLHHTNGINNQLLAPLAAGASVHVAPRFRAEEMPALMERVRPSIVTGVPTMYARMLAQRFAPQALAGLRLLRCGSAPLSDDLHGRIEAHFGCPLIVSYGLSEATCTSTMNPVGQRRRGSVGTPLAGQQVFLRGADGRRVNAPGRDGEICIAGPTLMIGYLEEDGDGRPRPPGEVLRSGDLGRFDDAGHLHVTGRLKEVIIRGGENLSPGQIEQVLAGVPGVAGCCVLGRADADLGEVPVAFIVRRPGTPPVQPQALAAAVSARLSRSHVPARFCFLDALPENSVGKVDRRELARLLGCS